MSVTRRLIVNADDFGRTHGINRGILEAHRNGIVTSTTLMVNQPASEAAAMLATEHPRLGVGLHLTLCDGAPVSEAPSLTNPDGTFIRDLDQLARQLDPADVRREIAAQCERFVALAGRPPTHIDSHKHLHGWPAILGPVIELARRHGLPVRSCDTATGKALVDAGVPTTDHFETRFFDAAATTDQLIAIIRDLPQGVTELMCHPGYLDAALDSSYSAPREAEVAALCHPDIQDAIRECGVRLITFADV